MTAPRIIHPRQCRAARGIRKITQAQTAEAIDVSASTLSLFERGKHQLGPDATARLISFFEARRVTFWLGEETGIYFALEDGTITGITMSEELLRRGCRDRRRPTV